MTHRATIGLLTLGLAASIGAAEAVPLHMNLAAGQGWKFDSTQSTESKNQATLNGQTQPFSTKTRQHRSGTVQVLAVNGGVPTAVRVVFDQACETTNDFNGQQNRIPYPFAGATVTVTRAADGTITNDFAGRVDPDTASELNGVLDGDSVVMPPRPVSIGDEWPGDNAVVARVLQLTGQDTGGMTLKLLSVKPVDGRPTAEVKVSFAVVKSQGAMGGKVIAQGVQLVDLATGHAMKADFNGTTDIAGQQDAPGGPNGQPVKYDVKGQGTVTIANTSAFTNDAMAAGPMPVTPMPAGPGGGNPLSPAASFAGTFSDDKLKVDLRPAGSAYEGTFVLGGQSFPAKASPSAQPGRLTGSFVAGGNDFPFTATLDGDTLTLVSGATTYKLKKAVANPLDAGGTAPANPLSR